MKERLGVYICHCGGNISDYVDVEKVRAAVEHEQGVVIAKTTMFACSDTNQTDMVQDIHEHNLDGVIVASCSPKLHLTTFRNVTERGDLNKYTYVHANIREQASWAHSDDKLGATEKAIRLVKAAIAKSRYADPLFPNQFEAEKTIAVIGGGIAGMKAALSLAEKKSNVILIEKENQLGGHTAEWGSLFMTDEKGFELTARIESDLRKYNNVTILTGTESISVIGIGVSQCHNTDKFNKVEATQIALDRAKSINNPYKIHDMEIFTDCYTKYYEDKKEKDWSFISDIILNFVYSRCIPYYKDKLVVFPRIELF